ncbi:MAG: TolC family protein [Bacteroidota bacterium]|nr:TolC family protein [Bacteroidota bacterium]
MLKLTIWLRRYCMMILTIIVILFANVKLYAQSQDVITIEKVYQLARKNYPLIKQRDLITKTKEYTVLNAAKGYLPVFSVNGQTTYQSTVTSFPFQIPGFKVPTYSKDQYKIYGEADQVIYDGGVIKNQKEFANANEAVQQQSLEVSLYGLYDRVNQLFFGALLMDEQLKQNELLKQDIQNGIDKAKALLANGTAYRSSVDELSAQLLQAEQARVEIETARKAFVDMLSMFINININDSTILQKPVAPMLTDSIARPEISFYDYQKKIYDLQGNLLHAQVRPKLSLFAQGGYGRPGLNMLSNNFQGYFIGGLRLNWNFGSLYTLKNQEHLLDLNKQTLDVNKETFLFNTKMAQKQQNGDVRKYRELLKNDDAIIALRQSVKNAASAQLENGVLSTHDYINEVNAEDRARQNKILHEMQLLQAEFNYQNTMGDITINNSINQ